MKQKKEKFVIVALSLALIVLLTGGAVFLLSNANKAETPKVSGAGGEYDSNVILDDPDTLQNMVDEMLKKAAEGQMALEMQVTAFSKDGENFSCYLANADANSYDMYMILYLDETQEELCRTGLIPVGGRIETLHIQKKLTAGTHTCTLTFVQVEADGKTEHAQVNVGLDLVVQE